MLVTFLQASISGLAVGGAYALVALGFSITFTTTKTLNFGQSEFVSVGALVGISIMLLLSGKPIDAAFASEMIPSWSSATGILATVTLMGLIGMALFALAVRPFAGKPGLSWVMSTIGFGMIMQSGGLAIWGPGTVMVPGLLGDGVIRVFGAGIRPQELLMLLTAVMVTAAFDYGMRKTMVGKAMRAVAYNQNAASLMGINVNKIMLGAFFISSALAGLTGILMAPIASASLYMGLGVALKGFCSAIVGGLNNPRGCVLGGLGLGLLESAINLWQAQWREVAVFLLVILVLAIKPNGVLGLAAAEKV